MDKRQFLKATASIVAGALLPAQVEAFAQSYLKAQALGASIGSAMSELRIYAGALGAEGDLLAVIPMRNWRI